jgi:hypothetical protein
MAYWHLPIKANTTQGDLRHKEIGPTEDLRTAATHSCCGGEKQHGSVLPTNIDMLFT